MLSAMSDTRVAQGPVDKKRAGDESNANAEEAEWATSSYFHEATRDGNTLSWPSSTLQSLPLAPST